MYIYTYTYTYTCVVIHICILTYMYIYLYILNLPRVLSCHSEPIGEGGERKCALSVLQFLLGHRCRCAHSTPGLCLDRVRRRWKLTKRFKKKENTTIVSNDSKTSSCLDGSHTLRKEQIYHDIYNIRKSKDTRVGHTVTRRESGSTSPIALPRYVKADEPKLIHER